MSYNNTLQEIINKKHIEIELSFKNGKHSKDFLNGKINRIKQFLQVNVSELELIEAYKWMALNKNNWQNQPTYIAKTLGYITYCETIAKKISQASIYETAQSLYIKEQLSLDSNIIESLPQKKNGVFYFNNGDPVEKNPNNNTRPLDLLIKNKDSFDFLYEKILTVYTNLKHLSVDGSGQIDQFNEVASLADNSPKINSCMLITAIIEGSFLSEKDIENITKRADGKNFKLFPT